MHLEKGRGKQEKGRGTRGDIPALAITTSTLPTFSSITLAACLLFSKSAEVRAMGITTSGYCFASLARDSLDSSLAPIHQLGPKGQ